MKEVENISSCVKLGCSACCRDIDIRLTPQEVSFLRSSGTNVETLPLIANMSFSGGFGSGSGSIDGRAYYHIRGVCGNLTDDGLCGVYDDPVRPRACEQLQPGPGEFLGFNGCNDIRRARGLQVLNRDGTIKK